MGSMMRSVYVGTAVLILPMSYFYKFLSHQTLYTVYFDVISIL